MTRGCPESARLFAHRIICWQSGLISLIFAVELVRLWGFLPGGSRDAMIEWALVTALHWSCFAIHRLYVKSPAFSIHVTAFLSLTLIAAVTIANPHQTSDGWAAFLIYPLVLSLFQDKRLYVLWSVLAMLVYILVDAATLPASVQDHVQPVSGTLSRTFLGMSSLIVGWLLMTHVRDVYNRLRERAEERAREPVLRMLDTLIPAVERKCRTSRQEIREMAFLMNKVMAFFPEEKVEEWEIHLVSLLHFVSRIKLPDYVFEKEGKLTPYEYRLISRHCCFADEVLGDDPQYRRVREAMRFHHERMDGCGYPGRLTGTAIPILAQVLGIVECYVAMTSPRSYRSARTPEEALREIQEMACTAFSIQVAAALAAVVTAPHAVKREWTAASKVG